ncbi:MAG: nuclear transport factor 2 family protein [Pseudomonadota bacterium]
MILDFLEKQMAGRFAEVAHRVAPDCEIVFSGGRRFASAAEITAFNAKRYAHVAKRMERTDVAPGEGCIVVYSIGALFGAWPDGTPFDCNRYIDRFEVRDGVIVRWEVWNDSGERLLERHGIDA